jgi:RNA polymerase sigma-70 factor (ECF subfamily)
LDYLEKGYHYDELVRKRVMYLYAHMPEQKPSKDWYDGVIVLLGTKNVE